MLLRERLMCGVHLREVASFSLEKLQPRDASLRAHAAKLDFTSAHLPFPQPRNILKTANADIRTIQQALTMAGEPVTKRQKWYSRVCLDFLYSHQHYP